MSHSIRQNQSLNIVETREIISLGKIFRHGDTLSIALNASSNYHRHYKNDSRMKRKQLRDNEASIFSLSLKRMEKEGGQKKATGTYPRA
ncbi:hypothetical protein CEXT_732271 [Caerostris extrusa]|uniref:Uncharacterized protein n=1 Tax=Caerostris extrusa TaxID=172846 RepID=A0AAV4Y4F0_CAEEX|nr:hypothetical protein CEXT_732271 [Caerostris extrusa]